MENELEQALLGVSVPDTATIQRSEAALKILLKGKQSVMALLHVLVQSSHESVRQLAAVLLRVKINQRWIKLSAHEQAHTKATLLHALSNDSSRIVRFNVCYVAAILSRHQLDDWPELLTFIEAATSSPKEEARELGFVLLFTLSEPIAQTLTHRLDGLCKLYLSALLNERDLRVRTAALRATASLLEALDSQTATEIAHLEPLVEPLLASSLNEPDEETCVLVVDLLATVLGSPLVDDHIATMARTLLQLCVESNRPASVRSAACSALCDLVSARPRAVAKSQPILTGLFAAVESLAREAVAERSFAESPEDDGLDQDEMSVRAMVEILVDALCENISAKKTQPLLQTAARLASSGPGDEAQTEQGLLILCGAIEGVAQDLREDVGGLRSVLALVLECTDAQRAPGTRFLACMTLNQLVNNLGVEMGEHHADITPRLLPMLRDAHPRVRKAAAFVVGELCAQMDTADIEPYVAPLVAGTLAGFASPSITVDDASEALRMLAAVASAAREAFAPHLDICLRTTAPMTRSDVAEVRALSTALMGELAIVAQACGDTSFMAHVPALVDTAMEGLRVDSLDVREAVFGLFAHLGLAYGAQLDGMAPRMLAVLLEGCVADDGDVAESVRDHMGGVGVVPEAIKGLAAGGDDALSTDDHGVDAGGAEDDDDDDDDAPGTKTMTSVRVPAADCKVAALFALETLLESTSPAVCLAFVDGAVRACDRLEGYPNAHVRAGAIAVLTQCMLVILKADPAPSVDPALALAYARRTRSERDLELGWLPGVRPAKEDAVVRRVMDNAVTPALMSGMLRDASKQVAARACDCWVLLLSAAGPRVLWDKADADALVEGLLAVLRGEAVCCVTADEDDGRDHGAGNDDTENNGGDDADDDEVAKFDMILADSACEGLSAVAKALGDGFAPYKVEVLSALLRRCKPSMPAPDRITALGVMCTVVQNAGCEPAWADKLFKAARLAAEQTVDAMVRRNAAFLLGVLVDLGAVADAKAVLGILQPMFVNPGGRAAYKWDQEDQATVVDNAAGAVARVVARLERGPLVDAVVAALVNFLPLRDDHEEDWAVYQAVAHALPSLSPATKAALQAKARLAAADPAVKGRMARAALDEILRG